MVSKVISDLASEYAVKKGGLLPLLHAVQRSQGCVDAEAVAIIADRLNLSRAEVHGVVSFYHDFMSVSDARPVVELCRAEACKARGVETIFPAASDAAGDRVNLKTVYCLGLCASGPNARFGDVLHSRLDETALVALVQSA